jgi:hypothetical protein
LRATARSRPKFSNHFHDFWTGVRNPLKTERKSSIFKKMLFISKILSKTVSKD